MHVISLPRALIVVVAQIKSLKQRHLQEKPTVLFPSRLLTQIYARMIRQIGKEMEITAEELKKDVRNSVFL